MIGFLVGRLCDRGEFSCQRSSVASVIILLSFQSGFGQRSSHVSWQRGLQQGQVRSNVASARCVR